MARTMTELSEKDEGELDLSLENLRKSIRRMSVGDKKLSIAAVKVMSI